MANQVFISYSHKDKDVADKVCRHLEQRNIDCWIAPRDIPFGKSWTAAIVSAITRSNLLLLIFSSSSNDSEQICHEVSIAGDEKIPILPFRIEDVKPSQDLRYYLSRLHWFDAMSLPVESHFEALIKNLKMRLPADPIANVEWSIPNATLNKDDEESSHNTGSPVPVPSPRRGYLSRRQVFATAVIAALGLIVAMIWMSGLFSPSIKSLTASKHQDSRFLANSFDGGDTLYGLAKVSNNSGNLKVRFFLSRGDSDFRAYKPSERLIEVDGNGEALYTLSIDSSLEIGTYMLNADLLSETGKVIEFQSLRIGIRSNIYPLSTPAPVNK